MVRIGVICPSEIAYRRFMPALKQIPGIEFVGIARYSEEERFGSECIDSAVKSSIMKNEKEKVLRFVDEYGGKIYCSYQKMVECDEIDAIYIPLPPALHYRWAKCALKHGKHVLVEKPATVSLAQTRELIELAEEKGLAFCENYMFVYHSQIAEIKKLIDDGNIGNVKLYKITFGFPRRSTNDFRYNRELGGGALLDAGGYTLKYANLLLGDTSKVICANMNYTDDFEVDIFGTGSLKNEDGIIVQLSYGMDNYYKCELTAWGSTGELTTGRVLTAPVGYIPTAILKTGEGEKEIQFSSDDTFLKSIQEFLNCISDSDVRKKHYTDIMKQAETVEAFRVKANEQNEYV